MIICAPSYTVFVLFLSWWLIVKRALGKKPFSQKMRSFYTVNCVCWLYGWSCSWVWQWNVCGWVWQWNVCGLSQLILVNRLIKAVIIISCIKLQWKLSSQNLLTNYVCCLLLELCNQLQAYLLGNRIMKDSLYDHNNYYLGIMSMPLYSVY